MRYRNLWLFLLLSAAWGTAFVAIKAGLAFFPPVLYAALRYDVAGLVMLGYAGLATERWRPRSAGEWRLVVVSGVLMIAAYQALLFVGEQSTTSAAAAVIVGLNPVLTTGFARGLLPGERISPAGLLGLAFGLAGVVLVAGADLRAFLAGQPIGEVLVLGAVAAFALGSVLTEGNEANLPVPTMEAWAMLVGAVVLHGASALAGESVAAIHWTPVALLALAYLALVASALGFLLYFDLLARLGPVEINLVSYVTPAFAALVGWLWLGELVDLGTAGGFLLVVVGFALIKRRALADALGRGAASAGRE